MTLPYPNVMTEDQTLDLIVAGRSCTRFGDGELKNILGRKSISQEADDRMAREMQEIFRNPGDALVCIPPLKGQNEEMWRKFVTPTFTQFYDMGYTYGSSVITRPDSAPWIDRPDYWDKVRSLWRGRDVVLVAGNYTGLGPDLLHDASSVRSVAAPRRDAYKEIDRIEEEIGQPAGPILICLGPCATVLSWRLAKRGTFALDLGHVAQFMRHAGAYSFFPDDLASSAYREQLFQCHTNNEWGKGGHLRIPIVQALCKETNSTIVLDYGCGKGMQKDIIPGVRIMNYDPGMPGMTNLPKPGQVVYCKDVLEHVEPEKLDNVIRHLYCLTGRVCYVLVATRKARQVLPDGRNAHLIIENMGWWMERLRKQPWTRVELVSWNEGEFDVKLYR